MSLLLLNYFQRPRRYLKVGATMARRSPQRGPGAEWLGGRSPPPEAETLLSFGRSMEAANLPTFLKSIETQKTRHLCCLANVAIVPSLLLLYTI